MSQADVLNEVVALRRLVADAQFRITRLQEDVGLRDEVNEELKQENSRLKAELKTEKKKVLLSFKE